jgi:hypothetical protein
MKEFRRRSTAIREALPLVAMSDRPASLTGKELGVGAGVGYRLARASTLRDAS